MASRRRKLRTSVLVKQSTALFRPTLGEQRRCKSSTGPALSGRSTM